MRRRQSAMCITIVLLIFLLLAIVLSGCRESDKVSYNVSLRADQFEVVRRITVINCRTDTVLFQLTGTFALQNSAHSELEIVCELPDHTYTKHFVYLNEWTTYTIEDLSGTEVDKYSYELNFLPENIPGVKITSID